MQRNLVTENHNFWSQCEPSFLTLADVTAEENRMSPRCQPSVQNVVNDEPRLWASTLFEPDDILEIRCIPAKQIVQERQHLQYLWKETRKRHRLYPWVSAGNIDYAVNKLDVCNKGVRSWWRQRRYDEYRNVELDNVPLNVYCSVNPRLPGGSSSSDVLYARCLYVDLENTTIEEAEKVVVARKLPRSTMVVASGHGVHLYWRLTTRIIDLSAWTALQKRLIEVFPTADGSIHDPARVMRLPGYLNVNGDPAPCRIVTAEPENRFDLDLFDALLPPLAAAGPVQRDSKRPGIRIQVDNAPSDLRRALAYQAAFTPALVGERNSKLYDLSANLVEKFGLDIVDLQTIARKYNSRLDEPLDDAELEDVTGNAFDHIHSDGKAGPTLAGGQGGADLYDEPCGPIVALRTWREQMAEARLQSLKNPGSVNFCGSPTGAGKSTADLVPDQAKVLLCDF